MTGRLAVQWAKLAPHISVLGPEDAAPRPAVLLFHGCGGVQAHLTDYAAALAAEGLRAVIVDSYAPRGWSRGVALATVCTGLRFGGRARTLDILAALWGIAQQRDVDASRIGLAGWSHGAWSINELMAMPLAEEEAALLDGVKALGLVYAYVGPGATRQAWKRGAPALVVAAERDHLGSPAMQTRAYRSLQDLGHAVETWLAPASHAFDQPGVTFPMKMDPDVTAECRRRLTTFFVDRLR